MKSATAPALTGALHLGSRPIRAAAGRYPHLAAKALAALLVLALASALLGCDTRSPACRPTPTAVPTPSATVRLLLGPWVVTDGQLAKTQIVLGEKVEFHDDGTFTWEGKIGQYSLFQEQTITLKRSAVGEAFEYAITVTEDSLVLSRGTNCGKEDRYVLARPR